MGKAGDWLGDIFGGFFANGGMPPMGKVSVVGENGPELFVPKSSGTIVPNNQIKQGNTQISVVINAKDIGSFRHSEPQIAAQMQRALNRARRVM
jgi:phage-related minor tail protein